MTRVAIACLLLVITAATAGDAQRRPLHILLEGYPVLWVYFSDTDVARCRLKPIAPYGVGVLIANPNDTLHIFCRP